MEEVERYTRGVEGGTWTMRARWTRRKERAREREIERWRMRSWVNEGGWARGRRGWIRVNESPDGRMKEAGYEEEGRIERR